MWQRNLNLSSDDTKISIMIPIRYDTELIVWKTVTAVICIKVGTNGKIFATSDLT